MISLPCLDSTYGTYHDFPPVITNFPLVKRRAVHLGLSIRMVIAANLLRLYELQGRYMDSWWRFKGILVP